MERGDLIANRFEVESHASTGGMGAIYRAVDVTTGAPVAVKVLHGVPGNEVARFAREAEVLAELRHPGIVRYVAHGDTDGTGHFLAMEWLDGTDLLHHLARKRLSVVESLALAERVAEALAIAHAHGIVHRDVKPANIFLVGGDLRNAKLLDFGIARVRSTALELTSPGIMIGTAGYMSPEQVRAIGDIDARADVYALGCVLFRCLAGRLPFVGDEPVAVIAKVALEDPPYVSEFVPSIPPDVDTLVHRMIARERNERPANGAAVAREIRALGPQLGESANTPSQAPPSLTALERRLVFLMLARGAVPPAVARDAALADPPTIRMKGPHVAVSTVDDPEVELAQRIFAYLRAHGGQPTVLVDGSLIVTFTAAGGATDLGVRAARCALWLRSVAGKARIAIASGRADVSARLPLGDVIDRAVATLQNDASAGAWRGDRPVALDDVTAALLEERFHIAREADTARLFDERVGGDVGRTVLGRATPFVGRDRELQALESLYLESVGDGVARGALVTGPAGAGKSRLRREFVRWLRDRADPPLLLRATADPFVDRSAYALLAQAIRRAFAIAPGDPAEERRAKIRARVARVSTDDATRAHARTFLGAMLGVPPADPNHPQWRAAEQNPVLMGDQIRRAFDDWLLASCRTQPVAIVLDDVQWADASSMQIAETSLRNLADASLLVVALARNEVRSTFPALFADLAVSEHKLAPLARRPAERLVRDIVGATASDASVDEIVARAAGNGFYLEELARSVASGARGALPETVLALVQSRIEALEGEPRRVLRAASVFGRVFPHRGVLALLGGAEQMPSLRDWLDELVRRDLIAPSLEPGGEPDGTYAFRQEPLRDAAYAMLTATDRTLGHCLAAAWLNDRGNADPRVVAEHWVEGGEPLFAVPYFVEAATRALAGSDLESTLIIAERGVACGASGEALGSLRLAEAHAHRWRGENALARERGLEAMSLLVGRAHCEACGEAAIAAGRLGDVVCLHDVVERLWSIEPDDDASDAHAVATALACIQIIQAGEVAMARELLDATERRLATLAHAAPSTLGHLAWVRYAIAQRSDPGAAASHAATAVAEFERAGDRRSWCMQGINLGFALLLVGRYEPAERILRETIATAEHMGLGAVREMARQNLGLTHLLRGDLAEARRLAEETALAFARQGHRLMEAGSRVYLARVLLGEGVPERALVEAERAYTLSAASPSQASYARAACAAALLALARIDEARMAADEAVAISDGLGFMHEGDVYVRSVQAQVRAAVGDAIGASAIVANARAMITQRAESITDESERETFFRVPENAAVLAMADGSRAPKAPIL